MSPESQPESYDTRPSTPLIDADRIEWADGVYQYQIDVAETASDAVVFAVNECLQRDDEEVPILEQTPIYEQVDPDALDSLFSSSRPSSVEVSFVYEGYHVTVTSESEVLLRRIDASAV